VLNLTEAVFREQLIVGFPCAWKCLLFHIDFGIQLCRKHTLERWPRWNAWP